MDLLLLSNPLLSSLIVLSGLALLFGGILGFAGLRFRVEGDPLIEQVDTLLPQSQCGQCGYPGCRPYAEAVVNQGVSPGLCPGGGQSTTKSIANLLGMEIPQSGPDGIAAVRQVAYIDETDCYGCAACIRACPSDAIVGANKQLHTVLSTECTGCGLCIASCDKKACISMQPVPITAQNWHWQPPPPEATPITLLMPKAQGA